MSEVKWIKITTDMFENRKIRYLRKLPDGNNIVLIWVMLLSLAGKCNANGMIFLTENVPYTTKMLADELDFEENTVVLAIEALERLGMIRKDDYLFIEDWVAHQNVDGLDKIREQNRKRVAAYRERQKALPDNVQEDDVTLCNVTDHYDVTQCNAPRIRKENKSKKESENNNININKEENKPPCIPPSGGEAGVDDGQQLGNNSSTKKVKKKTFTPPTLAEIEDYCKEKKLSVIPKEFYDYFTATDWIDAKGQRVSSWKGKLLTWEKFNIRQPGIPSNRTIPKEYHIDPNDEEAWNDE